MEERSAWICVCLSIFLLLAVSESSALDGTHDTSHCGAADVMSDVCSSEEGNHNSYCGQKMSGHCGFDRVTRQPEYCYNTLGEKKDGCGMSVSKGKACSTMINANYITPPLESLVKLRLYYHYSYVWKKEAMINLTFPDPTWKKLVVQYTPLSRKFNPLQSCRHFTRHELVNDTLMYDCRIRNQNGDVPLDLKLSVQSDSGLGASYLFKLPEGEKINPRETCPSDWHVFFYIHKDAIPLSEELPVTVQSSPYGQVKYRISMAKCRDGDEEGCVDPQELWDPMFMTKNTSDDLWTVFLPPVTTGGSYIVTVRMVAEWCPKDGCYSSVSPKFIIQQSSDWLVILTVILLIVLVLVSIVIMIHQRWKINKKLFEHIQEMHVTVLLVYHPENSAALSFVKTVAEFLKKTCYVTPLIADDEVGLQNPISWIKSHMNDASRVLFIVPGDAEAPSITTLRNLFQAALLHCVGHEFTTSPEHAKRLAKLVHPASGDVPSEIRDIRRFELSENPAVLANWLHGGSFLDQICLWLPHIMSSTKKNITPTWNDAMLAAKKIGSQLASTDNESTLALAVRMVEVENNLNDGKIRGNDDDDDDDDDDDGDGDEEDYKASTTIVFDPDIPDVTAGLCEPNKESISSPDNSSSSDDDDDDNVDGIFQ